MLLRSLLLCLTLGTAFSGFAQSFLSTNGGAIVNEAQDTVILRGMGLGGWMVQEGYMLQTDAFAGPQHEIRQTIQELIGEADTEAFYEAWLANHVRRTDIDSLKVWGFNSVRLPMHYNLYTLPVEEEPVPGEQTWLTKGFALTDSLISWCAQNDMYVVLDLHAAPGGQGMDANISDYDDTKPSLWESAANRAKMVALWARLAERYADEPWVAGYDLLNEPNWELPGNTLLRELYEDCTAVIRAVDARHIIFIEGNWFANDFTGLTPPWDDELVYSPHKYWSFNDRNTIQSALDLRSTYNVPLYLGESGENSNVWFRDAIRLLEDNGIGWAWWPMKKIDNIAGPLSVSMTDGYQTLLDYWSGSAPAPTAAFGRTVLLQLAEEGLLTENCDYHPDVIDAMFRQVYSDVVKPYHVQAIPGVVYASDFDMGVVGSAYSDIEVANYRVSTGNFTSWNNGWTYRNDGVDIEPCADTVNSNGVNVGWLDAGEWMQYTVAAAPGVYDVALRVASGAAGGSFYLSANGADLTAPVTAPATGGWQNWQTVTVPNVILNGTDNRLRFYVDEAGFNLSSLSFIPTGIDPASLMTAFVSGVTTNEYHLSVSVNKALVSTGAPDAADFELLADGASVPITAVSIDADNPRVLRFALGNYLRAGQTLQISYTGTQLSAADGTALEAFTLEPVRNTLSELLAIPGRIEAEAYTVQEGISLETTTDAGGGQNIGYLDPGDFLEYEVEIQTAGTYRINYRTAAEYGTGQLAVTLVDGAGNETPLGEPAFANTGGWQTWQTTSTDGVVLAPGRYTLRLEVLQAPFNLNWMDFEISTNTTRPGATYQALTVFPNPSADRFTLLPPSDRTAVMQLEIHTLTGQLLQARPVTVGTGTPVTVSLAAQPAGAYLLSLTEATGTCYHTLLLRE